MSEGRSSVTARRRRGGDEIRSGGRRARGRGQALVEFALILPVFFLLFAGLGKLFGGDLATFQQDMFRAVMGRLVAGGAPQFGELDLFGRR